MIIKDLVLTTDNPYLINAIDTSLPIITYEKQIAPSQVLTPENFAAIDCKSFDSPIGGITNLASNLYAIKELFDEDSEEYKEVEKRIRLLRFYQGGAMTI